MSGKQFTTIILVLTTKSTQELIGLDVLVVVEYLKEGKLRLL